MAQTRYRTSSASNLNWEGIQKISRKGAKTQRSHTEFDDETLRLCAFA